MPNLVAQSAAARLLQERRTHARLICAHMEQMNKLQAQIEFHSDDLTACQYIEILEELKRQDNELIDTITCTALEVA